MSQKLLVTLLCFFFRLLQVSGIAFLVAIRSELEALSC